jgi:hypothetical protein
VVVNHLERTITEIEALGKLLEIDYATCLNCNEVLARNDSQAAHCMPIVYISRLPANSGRLRVLRKALLRKQDLVHDIEKAYASFNS